MGEAETLDVDAFSTNRARQMLAMLDRDGLMLEHGDKLPRGRHSAMFAPAIGPSRSRPDGFGGLGIALHAEPGPTGWRLRAEDEKGRLALEAVMT